MTDQTQTTTEPVAWRIRLKLGKGDWSFFPQQPLADAGAWDLEEYEVQPLYTTPQPLAIGLDREARERLQRDLDRNPDNKSVCVFSDDLRALLAAQPEAHDFSKDPAVTGNFFKHWACGGDEYAPSGPAAPTGETGA